MRMLRHIWTLPALIAGIGISSLVVFGAPAPESQPSALAPSSALIADDSALEAPEPNEYDEEVKKAVDRGLAQLVKMQDKNGAWKNDIGLKYGSNYKVEGRNKPHIGVTALACMALVAGGSTPESGPYAANVRMGINFLISNQQKSGQFIAFGSRMYSHAFATLFMAEVYGMTNDDKVGRSLRAATEFILKNQVKPPKADQYGDSLSYEERARMEWHLQSVGGWRYEPGQLDADMSITVCQLQALRAAKNAGINIQRQVIDSARAYVASNYLPYRGAFMYQPSRETTGRDSFALTAAGIVALQSIGNYDIYDHYFDDGTRLRIDLGRSLAYLQATREDKSERFNPGYCGFDFWYGHYYAAQAFRQYAYVDEEQWHYWNDQNRRHFLAMQDQLGTGGWIDEVGNGDSTTNAYATAMACLILSISNEYLPIFQH